MLEYNWSTKVFLNLVWAALSEFQKMGRGKGTHTDWAWLWNRHSHLKNGEIKVRWLAQGHYGGLYYWINYCFLYVRGLYIPTHCCVMWSMRDELSFSCWCGMRNAERSHVMHTDQWNGADMRYSTSKLKLWAPLVWPSLSFPLPQDQARAVSSACVLAYKRAKPQRHGQLQWCVAWTGTKFCMS